MDIIIFEDKVFTVKKEGKKYNIYIKNEKIASTTDKIFAIGILQAYLIKIQLYDIEEAIKSLQRPL